MWPHLDSILNPGMALKDKLTYFNLVNHVHKLCFEKESDITALQQKIQELISSPVTRFDGYLFMDALMTNHPKAYIHNWGPIIIGSLKCSDSYVSKQLTLRILKRVVVNFSLDGNCTDAFQRFIPEILSMLLEVGQNDEGFLYCCQALAICMQYLPSVVGPHSDEIELFLLKHLDSLSHDIIDAIADCFAALPNCLGNIRKHNFKYEWLQVYLKALNTLQGLLNDMLKFPQVESSFVSIEGLAVFNIQCDPDEGEISYVLSRIRIFSSLCRCLAKMMSVRFDLTSTSSAVEVPIPELLQGLGRIFLVKGIMEVTHVPKCSAFLLGYPIMQNAVFVVLEALIINFTLIEQSGNFAKLMKSAIEATNLTASSLSSKRQIRSAIWKTLNIWLKQYGAKGSYEIVNNRFLIQELLLDVALDSENGHSPVNGTVELAADSFREECCFEALQVLSSIFTTGGSYIDKGLADEISTTILKTIRKIQLYLHPGKKFPYPYTNENCREKLYDSLLWGSIFGDPLQTKYINQAINIFKIAMKDPNLEINSICHKAFKFSRFFLNPKKLPPESVISEMGMGKALPPPLEEKAQTGWESGNCNVNNESSQKEQSKEVNTTCQIETVYHNSVENDSQRDLLPVQHTKSPIHFSETHGNQNQCNGNNSRLVSNKPPSHSNICNDSESDEYVEEYKECSLEEPHHLMPVDILPVAPTPIITSVDSLISVQNITNPESKIIELKPLEPMIIEDVATTNHHDASATDELVKCIDIDEEGPQKQPLRRTAENGMDVESEDEESGDEEDEEGTGSDEDEEVNEIYHPDERYSPEFYPHEQEATSDRCSPEYYDRPVKRLKVSNEEEPSSDDFEEEKSPNKNPPMMNPDEESGEENVDKKQNDEEEDMPNGSPTVSEMCRDFVLAEPEDIG